MQVENNFWLQVRIKCSSNYRQDLKKTILLSYLNKLHLHPILRDRLAWEPKDWVPCFFKYPIHQGLGCLSFSLFWQDGHSVCLTPPSKWKQVGVTFRKFALIKSYCESLMVWMLTRNSHSDTPATSKLGVAKHNQENELQELSAVSSWIRKCMIIAQPQLRDSQ